MRKKNRIERRRNLKTRTIYLFDAIDEIVAEEFIRKIKILDRGRKKKPIIVYISSPGGSVPYGFAMIDAILNCKCKTIGIATGDVCSMAPAIYVACDERKITEHTHIMLHPEWTSNEDYLKFAKSRLKNSEEWDKMYKSFFLSRVSMSEKKYEEADNTELWLTVKEAIKYRIAHILIKKVK